MALLIKPLLCPHCQKPMDKRLLSQHNLLRDFLKSKPYACPHCHQGVVYPEKADTLLSAGIFIAVILAPLFHYWEIGLMDSRYLFTLGVVVAIAGLFTQKLAKAKLPPNKRGPEENTPSK